MILFRLFLTFLEIGAVAFGGGYGMIPLFRDAVLTNGWLTEDEFLNFIAVAESTPGPIAVNMATFVGSSQAGFFGSLCATLGVILPSFFIILLIASVMSRLLQYAGVDAFMKGVRPCIVALILSTGLTIGLKTLFGIASFTSMSGPNTVSLLVFILLILTAYVFKAVFNKKLPPILMIVISAGLGIVISLVSGK